MKSSSTEAAKPRNLLVSLPASGAQSSEIRSPGSLLGSAIGARAGTGTAAARARVGHPPLDEYYNSLFTAFGPQHWWPGKTQFEVIVGAILTQNTSWTNVERAIDNLRQEGLLTPSAIEKTSNKRLERLVRSSGYFRQKARKLKEFCKFLRMEYRGSLKRMFATPTLELREKLLGVFGIGPETADSILLYGGGHSVFVVDAYTKRIMSRHGWGAVTAKYDDVRWMFERQFPGDAPRFNEFHALIVRTGKEFCRPQVALCGTCPLGRYREEGR
jgi:endonuclease-3 related protein